MFKITPRLSRWKVTLTLLAAMLSLNTQAQTETDIFQIMERTDLTMDEVENLATQYFNKVGTGQGSGLKHYERWRYEQQFHLNDNRRFIMPDEEYAAYQKALPGLRNTEKTRAAWTNLGPTTLNVTSSWNPGHGRCWTIAINPSNTSIMYAGTDGGGIWKTTNGGTSWSPLMDFTSSSWQAIYHIAIDPTNTSIVYAGLKSGGVLKSTNSGSTWAATGSGPSSIRRVRVHPTNGSIVFATGSNGIYRSTNGGTTWTQVKTGSTEDLQFNPGNANTMYASTSSTATFWRSTDGGVTWTNITSGITNSGRSLIGVSANNSNTVYIVQANGSVFGRLYKSTNGGTSFTTTVTGGATTNYFGYEPDGTGTSGQATHDMAIAVNPANANDVHIAGIICWRSTNGGTSFTATTDWTWANTIGYNHADVHSLVYQGATLYSASDGGIWRSTNDAGDWTDISSNMGTRQFYRIACAKNNASVISGGAQDNGSAYRQSTGTWKEWLGADGMDAVISPTNSSVGIGTSQYGSIYRTTNAGDSRTSLSAPASGNWVTPLCWHGTDGNIVFGGWNGVYRSTNQGTSWTKISGTTITSNVVCLAVAPSDANYIYASVGSTLYRTSNGGTSWTSVVAPGSITSICVSPLNASKIWITTSSTSNNVQVSTNMGTNFTSISAGLPAIAARSVAVENNANENLYVGMNIGVYYRNNINTAWVEHATGLPLVAVNEVEVQQSGGKLRVATYGRGVWESPLKSVAPKEDIKLQTYCQTQARATEEWIDAVQIGSIFKESGNNHGYLKVDDNHTRVAINNHYEIKVKPGFAEDIFKENWAVFIDYNQDGDFNDENETVSRFTTSDAAWHSQIIGISTAANIGYTTMRIVMSFDGDATPCVDTKGEVEDYVVYIGSTTTGEEVMSPFDQSNMGTLATGMLVYPNPASKLLSIELNQQNPEKNSQLSILNMNGQIVHQETIKIREGFNQYRVDVDKLAAGQYFVVIDDKKQQVSIIK